MPLDLNLRVKWKENVKILSGMNHYGFAVNEYFIFTLSIFDIE
jgi:hypothetical protein